MTRPSKVSANRTKKLIEIATTEESVSARKTVERAVDELLADSRFKTNPCQVIVDKSPKSAAAVRRLKTLREAAEAVDADAEFGRKMFKKQVDSGRSRGKERRAEAERKRREWGSAAVEYVRRNERITSWQLAKKVCEKLHLQKKEFQTVYKHFLKVRKNRM